MFQIKKSVVAQKKPFQETVIVSCPTPRKSLGKQMCLATFQDGDPGRELRVGARAPPGRHIAGSCLVDRMPHPASSISDGLGCRSVTWSRGESNEQTLKALYQKKGQKDLLSQKSVCNTCRSLFLLTLYLPFQNISPRSQWGRQISTQILPCYSSLFPVIQTSYVLWTAA